MSVRYLKMTHSMRSSGPITFENFYTNKNSHFGPKHDVFGPKVGFLLNLTTYIELWGHVIAQNEALDETKKFLSVQNFSKKKSFFRFLLHFRPFLIVFNENKKNLTAPPLAPFGLFCPLSPCLVSLAI